MLAAPLDVTSSAVFRCAITLSEVQSGRRTVFSRGSKEHPRTSSFQDSEKGGLRMSEDGLELGCKISLISKAGIRYEGRLFTVDPDQCTIALSGGKIFCC